MMMDLEPIKARAAKATPGPWKAAPMCELFPQNCKTWDPSLWGCVYPGKGWREGTESDARFKAHAREDVPALVTEVEELRGALAEAGDVVGAVAETGGDHLREVQLRVGELALENGKLRKRIKKLEAVADPADALMDCHHGEDCPEEHDHLVCEDEWDAMNDALKALKALKEA